MTRLTINKIILPIITFIIFLGIWEMVIIIGHYQPVLLPGPALVGKSIWTFIVTGEIFQHLAISLWRFVAGFVVALLVAIPLGFLLGRNRWLYNAIEPLFQLIRPISPIAWGHLLFYGLVLVVCQRLRLFLSLLFSQLCSIPLKALETLNRNI